MNKDDSICWINADNKEVKFSTKDSWLSLKENWPKVKWSKIVRFSQCNPKQAFILWMTIQDWKTYDLHSLVEKLSTLTLGNKIKPIINRLIISFAVYHIWSERNKRNFQNSARSSKEVIGCIEDNVRDMLKSLKVKNSSNVSKVASAWGLKWEKDKLRALYLDKENLSPVLILLINEGDWSVCCVNIELKASPLCHKLLGMDLSQNKSFTSVLVMPSIRASLPKRRDPVGKEEEYAVATLALLKSSAIRDVG
ncbi:hypothetical protein Tco_0047124 [Tanacetum coccineum]